MTRDLLLLGLIATGLPAAVIRGNIVENRSGKPLSRVAVALQPVAGTPGNPLNTRTNNFGSFEFLNLPAGSYLLKASRQGFLPLEYGQKLWNSAGQPVVLPQDGSQYLNLRLMRYGGIIGTLVDENDIGLPDHEVLAYSNVQPPQLVARGKSDDRGIYRISGLTPGIYVVRSAGNQDEGISYAPTFSKETQLLENARIVQVLLDEDSTGMDIRPNPGKLFTISGTCVSYPPDLPVLVTLASDMMRRTVSATGADHSFQFGALSPGAYEIYVEAPEPPAVAKPMGAYTQLNLSENRGLTMVLQEVGNTIMDLGRGIGTGSPGMQLTARRKDLAGVGPTKVVEVANNRAIFPHGRWELLLVPPAGSYVSGFYGPGLGRARGRPDGWNEFTSSGGGSVRFTLSGGAPEIHGVVKSYTEPAAGAPVYLEAYDPETRKRVTDLRVTLTDLHGGYRFQGLAPGTYRVLSTFEYTMPDTASMDMAGALSVKVETRNDLQADLDLYGIR